MIDTLKNKPCDERTREEFITFIEAGESSKPYLAHIDVCKTCQKAIEEVFDAQGKAFAALIKKMKKELRTKK